MYLLKIRPVAIPTNPQVFHTPSPKCLKMRAMKVANLSDDSLVIEFDLQEFRILSTALNSMCNGAHILDDLEERLSGAKDKAESLLISIRTLSSTLDR